MSAPEVGKGRAVRFKVLMISAVVRLGCTDNISATVPLTKGALKLVPRLARKASV